MEGDISAEDRNLLGWMCRVVRQGLVNELLAGNDTQCFSTEQYARKYSESPFASSVAPVSIEWAREHLEWLGTVREVKPDIWIKKE